MTRAYVSIHKVRSGESTGDPTKVVVKQVAHFICCNVITAIWPTSILIMGIWQTPTGIAAVL